MHHGLSQITYVTDFMLCHVSDSYKKSVLVLGPQEVCSTAGEMLRGGSGSGDLASRSSGLAWSTGRKGAGGDRAAGSWPRV